MQNRVAALEIIRGTTNESVQVQQPFPRVLRILRNKLTTPRGKDKIDAEELQRIKLEVEGGKTPYPSPRRSKPRSSRRK